MTKGLFRYALMALSATIALGVALPAAALAAVPAYCPSPLLSQPFAGWGDAHQYTLLPGEAVDDFDGSGWHLSGGARVVTQRLQDGSVGRVLDIPSGATAESP